MFAQLFAGSFVSHSLLLGGVTFADEKPQDCCSAKLACCTPRCEARLLRDIRLTRDSREPVGCTPRCEARLLRVGPDVLCR